jgi:tetratricopeptide (TPR) repeat protein
MQPCAFRDFGGFRTSGFVPGVPHVSFPGVSRLFIGLIVALALSNAPAAPSNVVVSAAGPVTAISAPAPATRSAVEEEFQKLMADDDAVKAETEKWISDNDAFAASGGGVSNEELNRRILVRFEPVRRAYRNFILEHPDFARARVAFGSLLRDLHDEQAAQEQWEKALVIETNDPAIYDNLATIYAENGPREKAFQFLEQAIQLKPREPLYYHNLADIVYLFRKDAQEFYRINEEQVFAKAFQLYSNALRLDPDNFPYATDIAMAYYAVRPVPVDTALQAWTNALSIAHDDIDRQGVYLHFARLNMVGGRFDISRRLLDGVTNENYATLKTHLTQSLNQREAEAKGTNAPPPAPAPTKAAPTNSPPG